MLSLLLGLVVGCNGCVRGMQLPPGLEQVDDGGDAPKHVRDAFSIEWDGLQREMYERV